MAVKINPKTPYQVFSKSLVSLKYVQFIQKDLEKIETDKIGNKIYYLNQCYLFHLVALWEVFIEEEVKYGYKGMMSCGSLVTFKFPYEPVVEEKTKRLNTPNAWKIDKLFSEILNFNGMTCTWKWEKMPDDNAPKFLDRILDIRHDIAHTSRASKTLTYDINFIYMKHLLNLAAMTEYQVKKYLADLAGKEFLPQFEVPKPEVTYELLAQFLDISDTTKTGKQHK